MRSAIATLVLAGVLLSGCASSSTEYPASTAADLQDRVLAVTTASADGDALTALTRLQELEAAAYAAAARSLISEARLASILSSIALVRADLEKALSEAELAELQKRLDELEQQPSGGGGGSPDSGTQSGSTSDTKPQKKAEDEAAKRAEKERKDAEEEQKKADEEARKAAEEQRKAEKEARKAEEEAAEQRAEDAEEAQEESEEAEEGD